MYTIATFATANSKTAGYIHSLCRGFWPYWISSESDFLSAEKQAVLTYALALVA